MQVLSFCLGLDLEKSLPVMHTYSLKIVPDPFNISYSSRFICNCIFDQFCQYFNNYAWFSKIELTFMKLILHLLWENWHFWQNSVKIVKANTKGISSSVYLSCHLWRLGPKFILYSRYEIMYNMAKSSLEHINNPLDPFMRP